MGHSSVWQSSQFLPRPGYLNTEHHHQAMPNLMGRKRMLCRQSSDCSLSARHPQYHIFQALFDKRNTPTAGWDQPSTVSDGSRHCFQLLDHYCCQGTPQKRRYTGSLVPRSISGHYYKRQTTPCHPSEEMRQCICAWTCSGLAGPRT